MKLTAYLAGVVVVWLALGPLALVIGALVLLVPRVRYTVRPTRRWSAVALVCLAGVVSAVVLLPDGRLSIPPGGGLLTSPRVDGRPASADPMRMRVPRNPFLAANGASSMHDDGWASDAYPWSGPMGRSPDVDTAWYGVEECATLAFTSDGAAIVALCGGPGGPALHLLDPKSLHKTDTLDLPGRRADSKSPPWADLCGGAYFYLDHDDRAVVATTDRRIFLVDTGEPGGHVLRHVATYDLSRVIPAQDCLVALLPDWRGNIWFVTQNGRAGFVHDGQVSRPIDLGGRIANSMAVDEHGGVYAVTDAALFRLTATGGRPSISWSTGYDRGNAQKPGQLSQGSGTTPTVLPGGLVAITDNADPRMHVLFLRTLDGSEVCRSAVFDVGASATENSLVGVGRGVIVENNYGYASPLSTTLGQTTSPGIARVDVRGSRCAVRWTSDQTAPTSVAKVSLANGLLYAYTLRSSPLLVDSWYLTALDVRTGRRVFSVRTGTGSAYNNHYAAVTLAPDGSAYIATLAGMVRVHDTP